MSLKDSCFISPDKRFYLLNGDTFNILPRIDFAFDMVFADPPYFLSNGGISYQSGKIVNVNKGDWDKGLSPDQMHEFNYNWLKLCRDKLKDNGTIWVSGTYHNIFSVANCLTELGYKILNVVTWAKTNPPPNISCRYFTYSTEFIIWARKRKNVPHTFYYDLMKKINEDNVPIVLFGSGISSSDVMESQRKLWRYNLVCQKQDSNSPSDGMTHPKFAHEYAMVFYKKRPVYHPQMEPYTGTRHGKGSKAYSYKDFEGSNTYGVYKQLPTAMRDVRYPKSILPDKKSPDLYRYLIRTYSNPGDVVLNPFADRGDICLAAEQEDRKYIGIEENTVSYNIAAGKLVKDNSHMSENKINDKELQSLTTDVILHLLRQNGVDVRIATDAERNAVINGMDGQFRKMTGWHGSGVEFDHFDNEHNGNGEGSQAHGWGTYIAVDKEVSEDYAHYCYVYAADQTLQLSPLRDGLGLELYAVFLLYGIDSLFATK